MYVRSLFLFRVVFLFILLYYFLLKSDTGRYLEWFKQVDELRGSIEMTSLAQAKAINKNGIYIVGDLTDSSAQKQLVSFVFIKRSTLIFYKEYLLSCSYISTNRKNLHISCEIDKIFRRISITSRLHQC